MKFRHAPASGKPPQEVHHEEVFGDVRVMLQLQEAHPPAVGGAAGEREEVIQLFRQLNEESGITVILVTHDPSVAHSARRTVVLRDGEIVEDTPDFTRAMQILRSGEFDPSEPEA